MSALDIGKIKFVWQGTYDVATTYEFDDVVFHDGSAFICVAENPVTASTPSDASADWDKIAQGSDLGAIVGLAAGDIIYFDGSDFTRLEATTDPSRNLTIESGLPTWSDKSSPIIQQNVYCNRASSTTGNGNAHYFGGTEFSCAITPKKADSIIHISICLFGETNTHDTAFYMQYCADGVNWNNMKLGLYGQAGSFKVGSYPDSDYNSTPHTYHYETADTFNTTNTLAFRLIHYNGGTFYYNRSVSTIYESGTSSITITELNADHCAIEWR